MQNPGFRIHPKPFVQVEGDWDPVGEDVHQGDLGDGFLFLPRRSRRVGLWCVPVPQPGFGVVGATAWVVGAIRSWVWAVGAVGAV